MKNYLIVLALLFVCAFSQAQVTAPADSTAKSLDLQLENVVTAPVYYLKTESDSCILLAKSQIKGIEEQWVDRIDISTQNEDRKKFGYKGNETLVFITLKRKFEKKFLESITGNL